MESIPSKHLQTMGKEIEISTENGTYKTQATKKWEMRKNYTPPAKGSIVAPISGTITDIGDDIETGHIVDKGQTLVVLEAMKMKNAIKSPQRGTLEKINVSKGDIVQKGQILAQIKSEADK